MPTKHEIVKALMQGGGLHLPREYGATYMGISASDDGWVVISLRNGEMWRLDLTKVREANAEG